MQNSPYSKLSYKSQEVRDMVYTFPSRIVYRIFLSAGRKSTAMSGQFLTLIFRSHGGVNASNDVDGV